MLSRCRKARGEEQGFTLLEMLVALAVFSLAALALVRLQGVTLHTAADLDSKAMGQIVARNLMVEVQTDPAPPRSEEHTSELQSLMRISYALFCLKKKNNN